MKTFVIGDIHGGLKALIQLLSMDIINLKNDRIIFLGDYTDGWSESAEVIDYIIKLKNNNSNIICIKGNHDIWVQNWLNNGIINKIWQQHGGDATMTSYINSGLLVSKEHKEFFNELLPYYIDEQNRVFIHAGYESKLGVGYDDENVYCWTRRFFEDAYFYNQSGYPMYDKLKKHNEIYIGHTPTINYKKNNEIILTPISIYNIINMDTGAGWNGKLTMLNVDTKEFYQSDFVQKLYKNEKGRN